MTPAPPPFRCPPVLLALLLTAWVGVLGVRATTASQTESGLRLLRAELPGKLDLTHADCDQLAAAVGRATLAHQPDAPAILRVALTRGVANPASKDGKIPSACARRIFGVSVAAAPTQASALLDLVTELYPASATELAATMRDYDQVSYDYKDRVIDDKAVVDDKNGPARTAKSAAESDGIVQVSNDLTASNDPASAPTNDPQDPNDLSPRQIDGLGFGGYSGFENGFAAGFPGAPGFVGSPPEGGLAFPPAPVTAAVNS